MNMSRNEAGEKCVKSSGSRFCGCACRKCVANESKLSYCSMNVDKSLRLQ